MEHMLYDTLTKKIQALSADAVRVRLGPEIRPERMRRYIQRIAHELGVPVTIRRVAGGVIFWRSTEEERQQAEEVAGRLPSARQTRTARPKGRQRKGTRPGQGRRPHLWGGDWTPWRNPFPAVNFAVLRAGIIMS
jgi:hypothetical protein